MKIAICEDDEKQREEIKKICDNYFAGINQAVSKKYCLFPVIIRQSGIRSDVRAGRLLKKDVVHTKEIENEMGS